MHPEAEPFVRRVGLTDKERLPPCWFGVDFREWTEPLGLAGPTEFEAHLKAYLNRQMPHQGGLRPEVHLARAMRLLMPQADWHDWTERTVRAFVENRYLLLGGAASCGKSYTSVWMAVLWWLALPGNSAAILVSTTSAMCRKRLWSTVQACHGRYAAMGLQAPGHFVDSAMRWSASQGDAKHSISVIAVEGGNTQEVVNNIKGHHANRLLVLADELDGINEAVISALSNLEVGAESFNFIGTENPYSRFSTFGKLAEPKDGWGSVSVENDDYETKQGGMFLHFDGLKSPNCKAGHVVSRHLIGPADVERFRSQWGADSLEYWRYCRGWFCPEGLSDTVFSEALFLKTGATEGQWTWHGELRNIASLDPAFSAGGDRCTLAFAQLGRIEDGRLAIQLTDRVIISINPQSSDPTNEQIAHRTIRECERRNVSPEHLIVDDSSGGLCDRLVMLFGPVVRFYFGGAAPDHSVSGEDMRSCKDTYANAGTSLWFGARQFLEAGLIKGADPDLIREAVVRLWWEVNKKKMLEPKSAHGRNGVRVGGMKSRVGFSPDLADAFCLICELARQLGAEARRGPSEPNKGGIEPLWEKLQRDSDEIYEATQLPAMSPFAW